MHVMMLAMDYPPAVFAGIGVHAHGLAKALSALGADVDVFVVPHAETIASGQYRVEVDGRITVYRFEFDYEDTEAYRSRNLSRRAASAQGRRARVDVPALPGGAARVGRPFRPRLDARPAPLWQRGRMKCKGRMLKINI